MTKKELVQKLSKELDCTYAKARYITDVFIEIIGDAIVNEQEVKLQGFGSWRIYLRKGYARTNKVTKKPEYMPPAPHCRFFASKKIKDRLQNMTLPMSKGQLAQQRSE